MLSANHASEKAENRQVLSKILSNVCYLARQGLPLRGDGDESSSNLSNCLSYGEKMIICCSNG